MTEPPTAPRVPRIAVDAMGGDHAPAAIVDGAVAAARHLALSLALVGSEEAIRRELARHPDAASLDIDVVPADEIVAMDEAPAAALRRKPMASIRVAAECLAAGRAQALFSAGSTGATVVAAHGSLGLIAGAERPAVAAVIPTRRHPAVLLDVGANAECRPQHLLQFAAMGRVWAQLALGVDAPRIGLLSIGEEACKGNDLTREAHRLLTASCPGFIGNVEGRDVYGGAAHVIVCDGFTGNVALKISEGLVEMVEDLLGEELQSTISTRVGSLLSLRAFRRFRKRLDYSEYGGAPLLGVRGVCIVGHGRSSVKAVRNGVAMAFRLAQQDAVARLEHGIASLTVAGR